MLYRLRLSLILVVGSSGGPEGLLAMSVEAKGANENHEGLMPKTQQAVNRPVRDLKSY